MNNFKFYNTSKIIKDDCIKINFGTDGFRGVIAESFNFDKIDVISTALGIYLLKKNKSDNNIKNAAIAIGYDTRFLSKEFALSCAENLIQMGFNVLLSDSFCPSPVLSYAVKNNLCECGIMITASHNPFKYNGIKFKNNYGGSMLESEVKEIEKIANDILLNKSNDININNANAK
ncbi:MAG: hypothetical protein ACYCT7_10280 [bacterium]